MDDEVKTEGNKYTCTECQNANKISEDIKEKDVVECEFCGIEYEVGEKNEDGNRTLSIVEEEK